VTDILSNRNRTAGAIKNVKGVIGKKGKKVVSVPAVIVEEFVEEMELEGEK